MQIFRCMFHNTLGQEFLHRNSRRVVRILADTHQSDAASIYVLQVCTFRQG
jgi:hypothetical protein